MIQVDANINAKDSERFTPLHVAAKYGHCEVVKCLIKHNADKDGNTGSPTSNLTIPDAYFYSISMIF